MPDKPDRPLRSVANMRPDEASSALEADLADPEASPGARHLLERVHEVRQAQAALVAREEARDAQSASAPNWLPFLDRVTVAIVENDQAAFDSAMTDWFEFDYCVAESWTESQMADLLALHLLAGSQCDFALADNFRDRFLWKGLTQSDAFADLLTADNDPYVKAFGLHPPAWADYSAFTQVPPDPWEVS